MSDRAVHILGGARTPFAVWARGKRADGEPGGALAQVDAFDLGAAALKGALERAEVPASEVGRVVFGNMYYAGSHGCYGARYVALRAGVPDSAATPTVSLACGSGLYALIAAAAAVKEGMDVVGTGGTDNISQLRKDVFVPSFNDLACGKPIGKTVDELALEYRIGRDKMDDWALRSHRRAAEAQKSGRLAEEVVPVGAAVHDDFPRKDAEELVRSAKPMFAEDGRVTAANTHALVDGGSALVLGSDAAAKGRAPLGRYLSGAMVGTPPDRMGWASVPALRQALKAAGLGVGDIDLYEINETFAAQVLIDLQALGIPEEKVNVNGGAIALGHPFAGTGAKQVLGLLLELRRRKLKRGAASICIGGGQGVAVVVEAAS